MVMMMPKQKQLIVAEKMRLLEYYEKYVSEGTLTNKFGIKKFAIVHVYNRYTQLLNFKLYIHKKK